MKRKLLLALVSLMIGGGSVWADDVPFLLEKDAFGGTAVSQLSTFYSTATTYTLELTGCVAGQAISVLNGSYSYTPTANGTVRFVRNGGDVVYVYEGTTYKGTATVSVLTDPTYPDIFGASDNSGSGTGIYDAANLFLNPGFETKGEKLSDHNYKATYWDCNGYNNSNKSRVRDNTSLTNQEGSCTFLMHGYGNPAECLSQTLTGFNNFTPYRLKFRTWWHDSKQCTYTVTIGTSAGDGTVLNQEITTPNNSSPSDKSFEFVSGAISSPSTYVFAITRKTASRLGNFDRMTLVAANGGSIGITGATSASFLSGSAFAPEGAFGAATDYSLASTYATSLVTNGTFDSNANGWTTTTGASNKDVASNQTGAFTGKYWENWNGSAFTGKMYQSVADVPNGTYKLKICAFVNTVDADKGQYVYANNDKSYVYTTTPTAYEVYTYVDNHTLEYGLNQTTAVANWMGIDNVSLEYCGASNVVTNGFKSIYDATTNHLADGDYSNVTGDEKTNLQTAVDATPTATADGYATATFDIGYADYVFMSAKPEYDRYVAEKANADRIDASIASAIAAPTTADGCDAVINSILVAEYNYVNNTSNFNAKQAEAYNLGLGNWTCAATYNSGTADTPSTNNNEHWSGKTVTYYEQGANGWGNGNWTVNYNKSVTLPAGTYVMQLAARASTNTTATMKVTIGETAYTEALPSKGASEKGITTSGVASFDDGTFANTTGRGWQWRYMAFILVDEASVRFDIDAAASPKNEWASFCNVELFSNVNTSELESALAGFTLNPIGFDKDEYAPYNNVEVIEAYDAATAIHNGTAAPSTQSAVDAITATLNSPTWTQNDEELNAFYDGDFSECAEDNTSPLDYTPAGWTASNNMRNMLKNAETYPGLADASATSALMTWSGGVTYGETTGYEMPLNANTVYHLTFKASGWNNESRSGITVSVLNSSDGMAAMNLGTPDRDIKGNGSNVAGMTPYEVLFVTGAAGNYVFHVGSGNNFVITDFELKKAASQTLTLPSATKYAAGTYPTVTLDRTFSDSKWNTLCVPFDFPKSAFAEVKVLDGVTVTDENASMSFADAGSTITAGTPCLVKASIDGASLVVNNVAVNPSTAAGSTAKSDGTPETTVTFVGTFTGESLTSSNSNAWVVSNNKLWNVNSDVTVGAYRAYFTVETAAEVKVLSFDFGDVDAIGSIANSQEPIANSQIYNLAGQRLSKLQRGVNIVNGKKVLVK